MGSIKSYLILSHLDTYLLFTKTDLYGQIGPVLLILMHSLAKCKMFSLPLLCHVGQQSIILKHNTNDYICAVMYFLHQIKQWAITVWIK